MRHTRTSDVECSLHVGVHDEIPILVCDGGEGHGCGVSACAVEDVIESPVLDYGLGDQSIALGRRGDIAGRC